MKAQKLIQNQKTTLPENQKGCAFHLFVDNKKRKSYLLTRLRNR